MKTLLTRLFPWLCIGISAYVVVRELYLDQAFHQELIQDVAAAKRDTTRRLDSKVLGLGDSVAVFQRRAVQAEQRADGLDRSLGLERKANVQLQLRLRSLEASSRASSVSAMNADSTRRSEFDIRQEPYTVHATVDLPLAPALGRMAVSITTDPIPVTLRISCGVAGSAAVRPATVTATTPTWATLTIEATEQSPEVCSASTPKGLTTASIGHAILDRLGIYVGLALVRTPNGAVMAGPSVGVGIRIRP